VDSEPRLEVNHQFDKSSQFSSSFHKYAQRYMAQGIHFFSPLQPLYELQIASLFARHLGSYHDTFISCNQSHGNRRWCRSCEKCAFVYALLSAFLPTDRVVRIFGKDLFADIKMVPIYEELLGRKAGLHHTKPFECVGEAKETLVALALARKRRTGTDKEDLPICFKKLGQILDEASAQEVDHYLGGDIDSLASSTPSSNTVLTELFPGWWRWPHGWLEGLQEEVEWARSALSVKQNP